MRVRCEVCGRNVAVKKDGRTRWHLARGATRGSYGSSSYCEGSDVVGMIRDLDSETDLDQEQ